jgi:hypothetical protein
MSADPSRAYNRAQRDRWIRRRFYHWRWAWFREGPLCQELNRLNKGTLWCGCWLCRALAWDTKYHRAREKRAWREAL